MAHHHHQLSLLALAATALCGAVQAQSTTTVTVTGRSERSVAVGGFGDLPAAITPLQATSFGTERLADENVTRIGDLTRLDASVGDAYNAGGYWSIVQVRGFTLDNRFNFRRDGLPINAETAIPLDNKSGLEILKGASGIQAGTSAPGGLVNVTVKRPVAAQRSVTLGWQQSGTFGAAADVGDKSGNFGWRANVAAEHLDPVVRDTKGRRWLGALALDWQAGPGTLLQAEVETSRQRQPSVAGFSMFGPRVPSASDVDVRQNLNRQPWNKPVEFEGTTASLRLQQQLAANWRLTVHGMTQRLKTNDRTAFPYGVYAADYTCSAYCDRFADDGSFTYWQFVSDNERRTSHALQATVNGRTRTGPVEHTLEAGVLGTRYRGRFQDQIFDIAGPGSVFGAPDTPPAPGFTDANTNRDERSTEFFARDAMQIDGGWGAWLGLRHTRLHRSSERTSPDADGSLRPIDYTQDITTPWLALSKSFGPAMVYASWGQGIESVVAPNRPTLYRNAGQALPALKSRQFELGAKVAWQGLDAALAWFDIDRPATDDSQGVVQPDGSARHRGLEGSLTWRAAAWTWQTSVMLLNAERRGSSIPGVNGRRPVNVPERSLRSDLAWRVDALRGLELQAGVAYEGDRQVLPYDDTVRMGGWARVDAGLRWTQALGATQLTWRASVDNLADRRAWKESPYQFGHAYLYPVTPRTWRASMQAAF